MARLSLLPHHGHSVEFSPYTGDTVAVTGSQNYGIAGPGVLVVFSKLGPNTAFAEVRRYGWSDAVFDVTWSEEDHRILVCGTGDGKILLFNQQNTEGPVGVIDGHTAEVSSVEWSVTRTNQHVLSSAWDKDVKMWDPASSQCVGVFPDHTSPLVYSAVWSPHQPGVFASVSGDCTLRVWDAGNPQPCTMVIPAHDSEVLSCDWNKYNQHMIVTGGVDRLVKSWDLRNPSHPVGVGGGHTQAVKRVKCCPHNGDIIASCSYDFSTRLWTTQGALLETIQHHTEFTMGIGFNLHCPGQMADCSWDGSLVIFEPASLQCVLQK